MTFVTKEPIDKGWSNDKKYCVTDESGVRYLLRVSDPALKERCDIPIFHDDQHGTAIVVAAALLNALKLVGKPIDQISAVFSGAGAAGTAIFTRVDFLDALLGINCPPSADFGYKKSTSAEMLFYTISVIFNFSNNRWG